MNDDELLIKYKSYKKKRNIIIVIISLLLILVILILSSFPKREENHIIPIENSQAEVKNDEISPVLELEKEIDKIEINTKIDYKKYIKTASDDTDGDLLDQVKYNQIDTSKIGDYEIVYYVFDSSNNMTQKILKITIFEKEEEKVEPEEPKQPSEEKSNASTPPKKENPKQEVKEPTVKYFMFTDGYTMGNVVEVCAEELKKSGRSGRCLPITDDKGIYLGMKLELN